MEKMPLKSNWGLIPSIFGVKLRSYSNTYALSEGCLQNSERQMWGSRRFTTLQHVAKDLFSEKNKRFAGKKGIYIQQWSHRLMQTAMTAKQTTCTHKLTGRNRGTPSYHPFWLDFPWNKPSSELGIPHGYGKPIWRESQPMRTCKPLCQWRHWRH